MRFIVAAALVLIVAVGCESKSKQEEQDLLAVSTPLPLDPTDVPELTEWWTNGTQLLQLSESGVYRLYPGINRYHMPMERGQWTRRNYAALWIEPYAELPRQPARVSIRRVGDELQLDVRNLQPMSSLTVPPEVLEDRLIGNWTGDVGSLRLSADLRYSFSRQGPRRSGPASLGREEGSWQVQDDFLILQPDSRGLRPTFVRVHEADDEMFLETENGRLVPAPSPFQGS